MSNQMCLIFKVTFIHYALIHNALCMDFVATIKINLCYYLYQREYVNKYFFSLRFNETVFSYR